MCMSPHIHEFSKRFKQNEETLSAMKVEIDYVLDRLLLGARLLRLIEDKARLTRFSQC